LILKKSLIICSFLIFILIGCAKPSNLVFTSTLESTQIDVNAEVSGRVAKMNFSEGDLVKVGDILISLDDQSAKIQAKQAEDALTAAYANASSLKSGSTQEAIRNGENVVKQAKAARASARSNYELRLKNYQDAKEVFESGGISKEQLDQLKNLSDTANQQLNSAQQGVDIAKTQLQMLKNGTSVAAQANVDQAKKNVDLAKLQLDKFNIKAPADGVIIYKNVDIGETVFPGSNIATISKNNDLWAKFYVPETSKHKVSVGKTLTITSKAYPNEKIKGKVVYVSDKAEFTPKNVETKEAKESTVFEVKVKVLNLLDKLKPGMTVDISIN
jgi:HlyD family secretion protein